MANAREHSSFYKCLNQKQMYLTDLTDAWWNNIKDYLNNKGRKGKNSPGSSEYQ